MPENQNPLTGQNLIHLMNIEKTIQTTQKKVSLGGKGNYVKREFRKQILDVPGIADMDEPTDGLSLISGDETNALSMELKKLDEMRKQAERKAEFGFGYRDIRDTRSDWMLDELNDIDAMKKLSRLTECSQCKMPLKTASTEGNLVKEGDDRSAILSDNFDMRLFDDISYEEQQRIHSLIRARYGTESSKRYLLVRSMLVPEQKIEPVTMCERKSAQVQTLSREILECPETEITGKSDILCEDISEDIKKKMKRQVEITPFCTTESFRKQRKWKKNLRGLQDQPQMMKHKTVKGTSQLSIFSYSDEKPELTSCDCGLPRCDCDLFKEACHNTPAVKKKCNLGMYQIDEVNNYLITCRENLIDQKHRDRRFTVLEQHAMKVANRETRESAYLQAAHDQVESDLMTCLMKVMPPQGQEVSDVGFLHVQELANVIAEHKMINERDWRIWRSAQARMENVENSDELDSFDSDIEESESSEEEISECNIKLSESLQHSRIPYFKETYDLANMLFEKIDAKLEKIVAKNHDKNKMLSTKPYTQMLIQRLRSLKEYNKIFKQICKLLSYNVNYNKKFIPFSEKRRRRRNAARKIRLELNRKLIRRKVIKGLQMGKKYTRPKRSFLYTEEENYRGFSPRRQRFLLKPGMEKFKKCNLVGSNLSGRRLTKKVIHNDYRLIRRMFDDQLKKSKESLWDPGMKLRMEEYLNVSKEVTTPTEEHEELEDVVSDLSSQVNQRRPKKDEQKTQTAVAGSRSNCKGSSGNVAETLASMIRSLRYDAGLSISGHRGDTLGVKGTRASFGKSTVYSNIKGPASVKPRTSLSLCSAPGITQSQGIKPRTSQSLFWVPRTTQSSALGPKSCQSLDSGTSRVVKSPQTSSSKPDFHLKVRPYTQDSISSFITPRTNSTVVPLTVKSLPASRHSLAISIKTLPPARGTKNVKNVAQKHPWKYSKIVR